MANETMVLLEKIVVPSGGASSVTFTSIPQSYTDLKIVVSARNTESESAGGLFYVNFNGSSANLSSRVLYAYGSGVGSLSSTAASAIFGYITSSGSTASTFGNAEIYIPNYTSSNNKSVSVDAVNENNATDGRQDLVAGLWSSSSAITSITIYSARISDGTASGNFVQYSTFYLYGVAKQGVTPTNAPAATGGDSIVFDGTYWIHTFRTSGTFTPKKNLTCDYAVVGGGGGGGSYFSTSFSFVSGAGGGGGGGVSNNTAQSFASATAYTVTIGAGATASYGTAGSGTSSSISGGSISTTANGGSGGGNGGPSTVGAGGTAATGGGSGGSGGAYNNDGDAGSNGTNVTWSAYYGGGGGGGSGGKSNGVGGTGGSGGGGVGMDWQQSAFNYAVLPGTANTGGGGGGATEPYTPTSNARKTGGNGGSGIVIIRYAA
jgi:hypothetical protein